MAKLKRLFDKKRDPKPFSADEFERIEQSSKLKRDKLKKVEDGLLSLPLEERRKLYSCGDQYVAVDKILPWDVMCQKDRYTEEISFEESQKAEGITFRQDEDLNKKIAIWSGNIAYLEVDCLINPCAYHLHDHGEQETVYSAIQTGGGKCLRQHLQHLAFCPNYVVTPGYRLPAKYILHVNGPCFDDKQLLSKLENTYMACFDEVKKMGLRTLAFPSISTGMKGIPTHISAEVALKTARKWLQRNSDSIDLIVFCVFTAEVKKAYLKALSMVFPVPQCKDTELPQEILSMDDASIKLYTRALSEGEEKVYDIRLKLVGHKGVGKSTLAKQLLQEKIDITKREITEGIDVHIRRCRIHLDTGKWFSHDEDDAIHRLLKVFHTDKDQEDISAEEEGTESLIPTTIADVEEEPEGETEYFGEDNESLMPKIKTDFIDSQIDEVDGDSKRTQLEIRHNDEVGAQLLKVDPGISKKDSNNMEDIIKEINAMSKGGGESKDIANVSIWDFAGQTVFYNTHQIFLASRTIFLLVSDISEPLDKTVDSDPNDCISLKTCKVSEIMEFWLNSIHFFCNDSHDEHSPPVILVATHADLLGNQDGTSEKQKTDEYFLQIRKLFIQKETVKHIVNDADIAVDNTKDDTNIEKLRNVILEVAKGQKYWGERRPAKWILLEKKLFELKKKGVQIIYVKELNRLNQEMLVPLSVPDELMLFLRFQNDLGNFLHFNDEQLRNYVVLNPQWLVDAFKCLVTTSKSFAEKKKQRLSMLIDFENKGKLAEELLRDVLCQDSRFENHCDVIINFLLRFYIIARPKANVTESDDKVDYFFAPCLLKNPPETVFPSEDDKLKTNRLCFSTSKEFMPEIIFNCLLAACISQFKIFRDNGQDQIFLGCGVFQYNNDHTFTVYYINNFVKIWVRWYNPEKRGPGKGVCDKVREFVTDSLKQFIRFGTEVNVYIDCPKVELRSLKGLLQLKNLKEDEGVTCGDHGPAHYISSSDILKHWFVKEDSEESPSILKYDQQLQRPTERQLSRISSRLGKEYKTLGHCLGLTQAEMDQIDEDNLDAVERRFQVLMKWEKKRGQQATFKELKNALIDSGIDVLDVLKDICDSEMETHL